MVYQIHPAMEVSMQKCIDFLRADLGIASDAVIIFRGWFGEPERANGFMQCHNRFLDSERYEIALYDGLCQEKAFDTLAHEMRHVYQYEQRWIGANGTMCEEWQAQFDAAEWYQDMPDEVDAYQYAASVAATLFEKFGTNEWRTGMPNNEIAFTDGTVYRFHKRQRGAVISVDRYYKTSHGNIRFEHCEGEISVAADGSLTIPDAIRAIMTDRAITEDEIEEIAV